VTTTPPAHSVLAVQTAEAARLDAAVTSAEAQAKADEATVTDAGRALDTVRAQLAGLAQHASVLLQQLAAAQTGLERHRIEQELDVVRRDQLTAELAASSAQQAKTRAEADAALSKAAAQRASDDRSQVGQELARATADSVADDALVEKLTTTFAATVAQAATVLADSEAALAKLAVLLGGPAALDGIRRPVDAAREADRQLGRRVSGLQLAVDAADLAAAPLDAAVAQARAELARVRTDLTQEVDTAQGRVDAAKELIDATVAAVPPPEQPRIDEAAGDVVKGIGSRVDWLITLPDALIDRAVAVLEAVADLHQLDGAVQGRLRQLADADAGLAAALSAALSAAQNRQQAVADVGAATAERQAALAAAATPADRGRNAFLRGE